jgi:hypothetical protein
MARTGRYQSCGADPHRTAGWSIPAALKPQFPGNGTLLEKYAARIIQRAGRLPAMPEQMKGDTLDGVIGPITFVPH